MITSTFPKEPRRTNLENPAAIITDEFIYYSRLIVQLYEAIHYNYPNQEAALKSSMIIDVCDQVMEGTRTDYSKVKEEILDLISGIFFSISSIQLVRNCGKIGYHLLLAMREIRDELFYLANEGQQ